MIYSGFCFHNEFDILRIKLEETRGLDIHHILIESTFTFSGKEKGLNFDKRKEEFSDFKIYPVCKGRSPDQNPWINEANQRNAILEFLANSHIFKPNDDDKVIITDVDEVVFKSAIERFTPEMECAFLVMDKFDYFLNVREGVQSWKPPKICTWKHIKNSTPDEVRNAGAPHQMPNAGHHYSFQGGIDKIMEKFASFSHQEESVQKHANREELIRKMAIGESLWGSDRWEVVPVDSSFPQYVQDHQHDSLSHLIFHP